MTKISKILLSSVLIGSLFQGCTDTSTGETAAVTTDPAIVSASRASTATSIKRGLATSSASTDSQMADIIYAFLNDDLTDASASTFTSGAAYTQFQTQNPDETMTQAAFEAEYVKAYFEVIDDNEISVKSSITDTIKQSIVDLVNVPAVNSLTADVFSLMLDSGSLTKVMLDMAIASDTMTQIMIDVMAENWSLSEKMCPMLQEDIEFGQKFMELALVKDNMAEFLFTYIDAPMYSCLGDAMLLPEPEININSVVASPGDADIVYAEAAPYPADYITNALGHLMAKFGATYLVLPTGDAEGQELYHGNDAFASIMFNTGTTVRGDGNELKNEKFFYAMFKNPVSTSYFVDAMNAIPDEDFTTVSVPFMDFIFLGEKNITAVKSVDLNQSYYNIISIAGAMYEGVNEYGISPYMDGFLGFGTLVVEAERLMPYGSAFLGAAYFYAEEQNLSVWTDLGATAITQIAAVFSNDDNSSDANVSTARAAISDIPDALLSLTTTFISENTTGDNLVNAWDCYWDANATECSALTAILDTYIDDAFEIVRVETEDSVNLLMVEAYGNQDNNVTLPAITDINMSYVSSLAGVTAMDYISGIDAQWLADFSENNYTQEYLYGEDSNVTWSYLPEWMRGMDWLRLPLIVEQGKYQDFNVSFDSGSVDIYFVSKVATATEFTNSTSLEVTAVDFNDEILSSDYDATYYLYKYTVEFGEIFDMTVLTDAIATGTDYVAGIFTDETD